LDLAAPRRAQATNVGTEGRWGRLSPDGRWLAYHSTDSGGLDIFVVAADGGPGKWQVSPNGEQWPRWSRDGKELLFFDLPSNIVSVPVKDVDGAFQFGTPQVLVNRWTILIVPFFDISNDGQKLLLERLSQQVSQSVTVVTNFTEALQDQLTGR
jgi:eukaryotic-like serine/threonine-protein kinase